MSAVGADPSGAGGRERGCRLHGGERSPPSSQLLWEMGLEESNWKKELLRCPETPALWAVFQGPKNVVVSDLGVGLRSGALTLLPLRCGGSLGAARTLPDLSPLQAAFRESWFWAGAPCGAVGLKCAPSLSRQSPAGPGDKGEAPWSAAVRTCGGVIPQPLP